MDMLERKENIQTTPMTKSMIRLDKEMDGILEDGKKTTGDKVAQYHQDLQRFLDIQEKRNSLFLLSRFTKRRHRDPLVRKM